MLPREINNYIYVPRTCTHMGQSHARPVNILLNPPKKRAGANKTPRCRANPISNGNKVPMSPIDPDISDSVIWLYSTRNREKSL